MNNILWVIEKGIIEKDDISLKEIKLKTNIDVCFFDINTTKIYSGKPLNEIFHFYSVQETHDIDLEYFHSHGYTMIPYGSIVAVENLIKLFDEKGYSYASYYDRFKFDLNQYISFIPSELRLNQKGFFMPFSMLDENKEDIFKMYGDKFFIRPNSGRKTFSGNIVDTENLESFINHIKQNINLDKELIFVSPFKNIKREYRFFISHKKILSCGVYLENNEIILNEAKEIPMELASLVADVVCSGFGLNFPFDNYVLDVAETDSGYFVIEVNSFNTSGIYGLNIEKIINNIEL